MPIVNLRAQLLRDDIPIGTVSFSYDNASARSVQVQDRQQDVFLLTDLTLQVNDGALAELSSGVNLTLSDAKGTPYYFGPEAGDRNLGTAREIGERFIQNWNFKLTEVIHSFVIGGSLWAVEVAPTGESTAGTEVSGSLGATEPVPIEPPTEPRLPNPIEPLTDPRLPNQSTPVNRTLNGAMRSLEPIDCGCQILFGDSMKMCLMPCSVLSRY